MRIIGNDLSVPRQTQEVASGTLPNGKPVVVNADGTVSVVSGTSASESTGTGTIFETGNTAYPSCSYDTVENKTLIVWSDGSSSYEGQAAVATVSGTSISFGSVVTWASGNRPKYMDSVYDVASGKHVIVYEDDNNNDYGTAVVATVSGTSVSFGTPVVFDSQSVEYCSICYDSTAQKVVIAYRDFGTSIEGRAVVGTVSGTSISFGSTNAFTSATADYFSAVYDSANNKTVIFYRDGNNSDYGTGRVFTVSGTSISFGSGFVFNSGNSKFISASYDSSVGKILVVYSDASDSDKGKGIVATVSGTDLTFGSAAIFNGGQSTYMDAIYHPLAEKVFVSYTKNTSSDHKIILPATISGTSVTFGSEVTLLSDQTIYGKAAYDSTSKVLVVVYRGTSNDRGYASVYQAAYTETNITSENYIGMSSGTAFQTGSAASVGSPTAFVSNGDSGVNAMAFDSSNNKVVIAYRDTNNYGFAVVATVSGSSVSFGTPVAYRSANIVNHQSVVFDSNANKVVVFYGRSSTTKAKVGTVSGTSISFGSEASVHNESDVKFDGTFDSANNKVVVTYKGANNYVEAKVGTISGTDITFGTAVVAMSLATDDNRATFDSNRGKVVICSRISTKGRAAVGTVSGTSISFASNVIFADNQTKNIATTFDSSNNKVVIAFQNGSSADEGQAVVGDIDSSGVISFGSAVEYNANANSPQGIAFDSNLNKIVIAYDATDTNKGQVISGTVSGTSITFDSELVFDDSGVTSAACAFDSNANKILIAYQDDGNSFYGTGVVFTPTSLVTTRGQVADGGHALVDTQGAISDNQIGLTAGQSYFVQTDGTIGTTADDPSVFAGTAVSATKLIVKG